MKPKNHSRPNPQSNSFVKKYHQNSLQNQGGSCETITLKHFLEHVGVSERSLQVDFVLTWKCLRDFLVHGLIDLE